MSPRNLEMEQTGESAKSPSYQARQANSDTAKRRGAMSPFVSKVIGLSQFNPYPQKNPATGQSWFEAPSAEYQAWEKKSLDNELAARKTQGDQDIAYTDTIITKLRPKANDEANRAYGMKLDNDNRALGVRLATEFPYKKYETETTAARESMSDTLRTMPSFLNRNTAVKPQQYVSF